MLGSDDGKDEAQAAKHEARFRRLRDKMVEKQIRQRGVKDEKVIAAINKVLRHKLVPPEYRHKAYDDKPLPIGHGQTISQPYVVALMTELLSLDSDARVLEVGTGSGYQAAVLAEIVKDVYSIEIYPQLHARAARDLQQLGYENIHLRRGDGALGWSEHGPYDAIIVTCATSHIPPKLIQQLKPEGRMCIPVGPPFGTQRLLLVEKKADGKTSTRTITQVRFVPLLKPDEIDKK